MFFLVFLHLLISIPFSISQPLPSPSPSPSPPPSDLCNGVFLSYTYTTGKQLPPHATDPSRQPYSFDSTATILNNGLDELESWKLFVGFQYDEYLVSATNVVLDDGTTIPANVGNGTTFAGFPNANLQSAVDTAGDLTQMEVQIRLVGTQYGVADPDVPMPSNIALVMDGFSCPVPTMQGKNVMNVCCVKDPNFNLNLTDGFLTRQYGDLTIDYDVLRSYDAEYYAQVKISNHNQLGRLDNWNVSWDWMRDEFIYALQGAYPSIGDSNGCIYGPQGSYYKDLDFSTVLTCEKRPTIIDLPPSKANDSVIGLVPFCCRDGIILPPSMDPTKTVSQFRLQVKKMPPDLNKTRLVPPQNWKINGTLNPDYECGPPLRVSPTQFLDASGLPYNRTAVASWQVTCNITQPKEPIPRCCVSFSAFYNDSVIPCNTCACGCPSNSRPTCSSTASALLLRPETLLVPFVNRTRMAVAWANIKHQPVPDPLPCGDNCGVSINWHINTDYRDGWSSRITLFNWGEDNFVDWFAAMQFEKAIPGFEKAYSFNGSVMSPANNTIFMQGLEGLNYLMAQVNGTNPSIDPPVPGKQQSVILFTKKTTPGLNIIAGDGFPTKVFFNGEECSLPTIFPTSNVHKIGSVMSIWLLLLATFVLALMQQ